MPDLLLMLHQFADNDVACTVCMNAMWSLCATGNYSDIITSSFYIIVVMNVQINIKNVCKRVFMLKIKAVDETLLIELLVHLEVKPVKNTTANAVEKHLYQSDSQSLY